MAIRVDAALPVHALTVTDVDAVLGAGILSEDDHTPRCGWTSGRRRASTPRPGSPEYWVLDVQRREIVVHREPCGSRYEHVRRIGADDSVSAVAVALTVAVAALV